MLQNYTPHQIQCFIISYLSLCFSLATIFHFPHQIITSIFLNSEQLSEFAYISITVYGGEFALTDDRSLRRRVQLIQSTRSNDTFAKMDIE